MSIFNSLGSSYSTSLVWRALFGWGSRKAGRNLTEMLEERYGGKAIVVYRGREALRLGLDALKLPKGSAVAISGFTCFAVYKAVASAGHEVAYIDIDPEQLNFSAAALEAAIQANPRIQAVIIQNTLGYTCDIAGIAAVCHAHNVVLIEDLAHGVGTFYADGSEVGTVGDMVMLSFGRDKLVDAVSGGALIIRNPYYQSRKASKLPKPPLAPRARDRFYPALTAKIRFGYKLGIGKFIHAAFKGLGLLSKSVDGEFYGGHSLPKWYCALSLKNFTDLEANLSHRQAIAQVYAQKLKREAQFLALPSQTFQASNLRFPIRVKRRQDLIAYLTKHNVYIADTWYDVPIAPPRYFGQTTYKSGQCPGSEQVASQILNLPTHRGVSENDAIKISEHINTWLKSK